MVNVGQQLVISILLLLLVGGGTILLQVVLSRMQSKVPGLILPVLAFLLSLVVVLSLSTYVSIRSTAMYVVTTEEGEVFRFSDMDSAEECLQDIGGEAVLEEQRIATPYDNWGSVLLTFLLWNIPTAVYLVLYFAVRRPKRDQRPDELERMRIDDLE